MSLPLLLDWARKSGGLNPPLTDSLRTVQSSFSTFVFKLPFSCTPYYPPSRTRIISCSLLNLSFRIFIFTFTIIYFIFAFITQSCSLKDDTIFPSILFRLFYSSALPWRWWWWQLWLWILLNEFSLFTSSPSPPPFITIHSTLTWWFLETNTYCISQTKIRSNVTLSHPESAFHLDFSPSSSLHRLLNPVKCLPL